MQQAMFEPHPPPPVILKAQRLTVAFPPARLANGTLEAQGEVGWTASRSAAEDAVCSEAEMCPLTAAWYGHVTRRLQEAKPETFVSVLVPHQDDASPAAIAEGMSYRTLADGGIEVDVGGAVSQPTTIKVLPAAADGKGATAWVVHRGA